MPRSIKININSTNNIKALADFLKQRRSKTRPELSSVKKSLIPSIYNQFILPMLNLWSNPKSKITESDLIDFMGEVFALSIYSIYNTVSNWEKDPKLSNNLTPDFLINNSDYVEIYSPEIDFWKNVSSTAGFQPAAELLTQNTVVKTVETKSNKYSGCSMVILVIVYNYPFPNDLSKIYEHIKHRPEHRIVGMYGSAIVYDSSGETKTRKKQVLVPLSDKYPKQAEKVVAKKYLLKKRDATYPTRATE